MNKMKVVIFLATFNGEKFLKEQLNSIKNQTYNNWELWVSDDGSSDNTLTILQQFQELVGNVVHIVSGPRQGYVANFLSLLCKDEIKADYYAFCDQDDIWGPSKLQHALECLASMPNEKPLLYCSRTKLIDEKGSFIGYSSFFTKPPSFLNALVQNIAGGNTMVFNNVSIKLLRCAGFNPHIVCHDWWLYLLVTGAGGSVFYDSYPSVLYRQHNANLIGSNLGWKPRLLRLKMLLQGRFQNWNTANITALLAVENLLTEQNKHDLHQFIAARSSSLFSRIITIKKLGVYRQTIFGNIGLAIATVIKKM
ncbi:MAG: glycosyltransferase family 2 protein [Legionella sp.]|jgi:glycosyltransferase involved in cell wall biosynthesis